MGTLLFRLDDITPSQNWKNFERIHKLFQKYQIAPLIGVVPDNQDKKLRIEPEKVDYYEYLRELRDKEHWVISQHGYQHTYVNDEGGLLKVNRQSEFAGLSYEEQYEKLQRGQQLLQNKELCATMFMAPAHTFDATTMRALRDLGFKWVTDGYTDHAYKREGLIFIPCTVSKPIVPKKDYVNTVCYHPNMMTEEEFRELEEFLEHHADVCESFGHYMDRLLHTDVPVWNFRLFIEQQKNQLLRKIKHFVAMNALCQAFFRARAGMRSR